MMEFIQSIKTSWRSHHMTSIFRDWDNTRCRNFLAVTSYSLEIMRL